jgi:acetyl esterase/lipase
LWGSSAGAHLASLAAYTCDVPTFAPTDKSNANSSDCVQGFVGWYGPYDLAALVQAALDSSSGSIPMNNPEIAGAAKFFSCTLAGCPPEILTQASTATHVSRQDPPTLLIHGAVDSLVPVAQSEVLATKLRTVGVPVELVIIQGADHDFKGQTQASTRTASLQALSATFAFFDQRLLAAAR